jgi:IstB-like ATP binding protein
MPAAGRVYRPESSQRSADGHGVEPTAQQHTTRLSEDGAGNVFERIIAVLGQYVVSPAGIGKSWLACALGFRACRENFSVLYQRLPRLLAASALAVRQTHASIGTDETLGHRRLGTRTATTRTTA